MGLDRGTAMRIASIVGALAVVQVGLATYYWLPTLDLGRALAPTWDVVVLLAVIFGLGVSPVPPAVRRAVRVLLAAVVVIAVLFGFGQGFARREFGYDVQLAIDLKYVPVLLDMMWRTEPLGWYLLHCAVLALALMLAIATVYLAVRQLERAAATPRFALGAGLVLAALAVGFGTSGPLAARAAEQLDFALHKQERLRAIARDLEAERPARHAVPLTLGERTPTILFFVVESYGAAVFDQPRFTELRQFIEGEAGGLALAGYGVRSRMMTSPVFGGSSWMADASMLCGVAIGDQKRYASLYQADIECLPRALARHGYRSILAAANTTFADEEFRRRFPFDQFYLRDSFDYQGPRYAWSYVPDQFVINAIDRQEIAPPHEQPLFAFFMLTSSHHPWRRVPPYIERWDQLGDGAIYREVRGATFANNFVSGDRYVAGFEASTRYALRAVFDYLRRLPADQAPLIVVLGDHQPRKPVAEMETDEWAVPVHVLSRDPALLAGFAAQGYVDGITPDRRTGAPGIERLVEQLSLAIAGAR